MSLLKKAAKSLQNILICRESSIKVLKSCLCAAPLYKYTCISFKQPLVIAAHIYFVVKTNTFAHTPTHTFANRQVEFVLVGENCAHNSFPALTPANASRQRQQRSHKVSTSETEYEKQNSTLPTRDLALGYGGK